MKSILRSFFAAAVVAGVAAHARAQGPLVAVTNTATDNSVSIFTAASNGSLTLAATVPVGTNPIYTAMRGDQAYLYVANSNSFSISVIDTRTLTVVQTFPISTADATHDVLGIAISPDGTKAYAAARTTTTQTVRALSVDPTTGQIAQTGSVTVPQGPRGLKFSPDGTRLYVVSQTAEKLSIIDTSTDTVITTLSLGSQPIDIAISPDGTRGYVNNFSGGTVSVINLTNNTVIGAFSSGASGAYGIAVARDGATYFTATRNDSKIHQFKTSDNTEIGTGIAADTVAGDLAISADGAFLYAVNGGPDNVGAFAIAAGTGGLTAINTYATGADPIGAAIGANGNAMLATGKTFVAKRAEALASTGSGGASFTGGTLLIDAPSLSLATAIAFSTGGGTINTNGNDTTISSVLSGTGAFTKSGAGALNLTGTNTYTGTTTVNAGTLRVNGSLAAGSAVTVASGGTLGGAGSVGGSVTIATGGAIAPGNSLGTLAVGGSVTWNGSATAMPFELGASNTADKLAITGALTKAGSGPYRFDFGGAATVGSYTLMTFANTTFAASDFSFVNLGGGLIGTFEIVGGNTLVFSANPPPKVGASIVVTNLSQVYDGRPKTPTITTTPGGLTLNVLYQSVPDFNVVSAPTNPGTYRVLVSVADAVYSGGAIETFTITPAIAAAPQKVTTGVGGGATFTASASGGTPTYQWKKNGVDVPGATGATLVLTNVQPTDVGLYTVTVTSGGVAVTTAPVPLELTFTGKVAGAASEVAANITHPNGNVYDQVLLSGAAASVKADAGQVTRVSFVDLTNDIVQVEFSGAGVLTITLDNASGPAAAVNYNQPGVSYMKGHATLTITGADATTNLGVFSVGSATAVNQALFKAGTTYDGFADLALVSIASGDGKFGGVRTGNASYFATKGLTGVYAPGVAFSGPLLVGDISGSDAAGAVLVTGAVSDAQVTGGDLLQANNGAVTVSGMTTLKFSAGTKADGTNLPAQANRARLLRDGIDVTSQLVK